MLPSRSGTVNYVGEMSGFQNEQKKEHQGEAEFADSGTISSVLALAMVAFPCMVPGAPV
jgi:hypothetical protein